MKRKNYLVEDLSKEEKSYLKRVVMTARNKYIEKNSNYINSTVMLDRDESIIDEDESVIDAVIKKCQEEINSAVEFERTMSNPELYNIVKALSFNEKEVLFYLYKKQKNISEIAKILKLDRKTVRKYRDLAQSKIADKLINGDD